MILSYETVWLVATGVLQSAVISTSGWTTFPGRSKGLNSVVTVSVAFPVSCLMGAWFLLGVMWLLRVTLPPPLTHAFMTCTKTSCNW